LTGGLEALAFCTLGYLWHNTSGTETSLGGLCGAGVGDHTINVSRHHG